MRRGFTHVLVCVFLLLGGLCTYTCLSQVEHMCCHDAPTVASLPSHPAVSAVDSVPALPEIGFVFSNSPAASYEVPQTPVTLRSRSLPPLILRL